MLALTSQVPVGPRVVSGSRMPELSVRGFFRGETACMRAVVGRFCDVLAVFRFAKT